MATVIRRRNGWRSVVAVLRPRNRSVTARIQKSASKRRKTLCRNRRKADWCRLVARLVNNRPQAANNVIDKLRTSMQNSQSAHEHVLCRRDPAASLRLDLRVAELRRARLHFASAGNPVRLPAMRRSRRRNSGARSAWPDRKAIAHRAALRISRGVTSTAFAR